jgi:endo-1,4-beta-xylanase
MVGSFESDGSTYDIWKHPQVSLPTVGTEVYWQYYSVRRDMRSSGGTVTTANHFAAWAKNGMKLGTMDYQILATEGYKAVGSSNYTVSG